jgi:hypothetical protein
MIEITPNELNRLFSSIIKKMWVITIMFES